MWYVDDLGLDMNGREFLWDVIKKVDAAYLRMVNEKLEANRPRPRPTKGLPHG